MFQQQQAVDRSAFEHHHDDPVSTTTNNNNTTPVHTNDSTTESSTSSMSSEWIPNSSHLNHHHETICTSPSSEENHQERRHRILLPHSTSLNDISQMSDEDIKILSNIRRKRHNFIHNDQLANSPTQQQHELLESNSIHPTTPDTPTLMQKNNNTPSIRSHTTINTFGSSIESAVTYNLLHDFTEIVNNPLFGEQIELYYFRGIYPAVDALYETYDYEAASHLLKSGLFDFDTYSGFSFLKKLEETSDTSRKVRKLNPSGSSNNLLLHHRKLETTSHESSLTKSSSFIHTSHQPYEHYFSCIEVKSLEPLFTQEYQDKYDGFNERESSTNIIRDENGSVKAASLDKLIVLLTSNEEFDNEFMQLFLLTYRSFTTSTELLEKLIQRYNTPPPEQCLLYEREKDFERLKVYFENFHTKILKPIRLRVGQVMSSWLQHYYYDFREDSQLKMKLEQFICEEMNETGMKTLSKTLQSLLQRSSKRRETFKLQQLEEVKLRHEIEGTLQHHAMTSNSSQNPLKKIASLNRLNHFSEVESLKSTPLWQLDKRTIALQLTLVTFRLFEKLRPKEFLNLNWMKETRRKKAPNIYAMINLSNEIGMWVATEILNHEEVKERSYVLKRFIKIASECEKTHNYNTMYDIVSGLNSNPIHRLKKSWDLVPEKWRTKFHELVELTSPKRSYAAMRQALSNYADQTVLPYIGIFLTDFLFIEEGNSDFTKEGNLINFSKRRLLGQLIRQVQTYQQNSFNIDIIPILHQRLTHLLYRPMEELYEISCKLEAPPAQPKKNKKKPLVVVYSTEELDDTKRVSVEPASPSVVAATSTDLSDECQNVMTRSSSPIIQRSSMCEITITTSTTTTLMNGETIVTLELSSSSYQEDPAMVVTEIQHDEENFTKKRTNSELVTHTSQDHATPSKVMDESHHHSRTNSNH
ncbi:hypothetical protein C9374_014732 [Naegleria lovaniensis]|uniref:RasGEF domain-containing protein n=1 Tax=Naegleria lovaniensis TaxID=51637 RepID=A0AA88KCJ3_NAELO|nr:uncharacterized protein C9374_014732 [Naegleria lovaniensis]KAG2370630.1 hypothetical protein C9374_014732 [Naegleria lovaniensis]